MGDYGEIGDSVWCLHFKFSMQPDVPVARARNQLMRVSTADAISSDCLALL